MKPLAHAEVDVEVPFHDVDALGIVWHGHYVKYLELARTALMRGLGLDIEVLRDHGVAYPVATCELKYIRPLAYGNRVTVHAELLEFEYRLRVRYRIETADGTVTTKAETTQVAVDLATRELRYDTPAFVEAAFRRLEDPS